MSWHARFLLPSETFWAPSHADGIFLTHRIPEGSVLPQWTKSHKFTDRSSGWSAIPMPQLTHLCFDSLCITCIVIRTRIILSRISKGHRTLNRRVVVAVVVVCTFFLPTVPSESVKSSRTSGLRVL